MRKSVLLLAMVLVSMLALMGCRKSAPIENPMVSISNTTDKALTQKDIRAAIITACPMTGWVAREISDNTIEARLEIRAHTATVHIVYSATDYNIVYKSSTNLNAKNGNIHPYYNGWIENLRKNIDREISARALR